MKSEAGYSTCRRLFALKFAVLFVCDSGEGKSALYQVWTMHSGVVGNWDGVFLGNGMVFFPCLTLNSAHF